ncbi:hypothetical protein MRX96_029159 [Rhipicephalus microplus]
MTFSARKPDRALASVLVKPCDYPFLATAIVEIRAWDTLSSGASRGDGLLCLPEEVAIETKSLSRSPQRLLPGPRRPSRRLQHCFPSFLPSGVVFGLSAAEHEIKPHAGDGVDPRRDSVVLCFSHAKKEQKGGNELSSDERAAADSVKPCFHPGLSVKWHESSRALKHCRLLANKFLVSGRISQAPPAPVRSTCAVLR